MHHPSKRIQLINTYSINNVGDAAIYATLLKLLRKNDIDQISVSHLKESEDVLNAYLGENLKKQNTLKDNDFLAVGGDIFNNSRPNLLTKQFINNLIQLSKRPKSTFVFGQSIPRSCSGISFRILCNQLKKVSSVIVRDQESFYRLQQAGVAVKLSYDSVFAAPINQHYVESVQSLFKGQLSKTALISLRSFDQLYPHDNQAFAHKIEQLIKRFKQEGLRVSIILQSQVDQNDSDMEMIKKINSNTSVEVINPFSVQEKLPHISPWQITQAVISLAKIVVGVRYHTSVFRLISGKMPFNLYYSNKGEDLCQRLGVPGSSINNFSVKNDFSTILNTESQTFNSKVIADQVNEDFTQAVKRLNLTNSF